MKPFSRPKKSWEGIDSGSVAEIFAVASDISIVLDGQGKILDLAVDCEGSDLPDFDSWAGSPWIETVTVESRPKIDDMIATAARGKTSRSRQVNHQTRGVSDMPVLYRVTPIGRTGRLLATGRDLRSVSAAQRRLIEMQHEMERRYARFRDMETRSSLLFESSEIPILVVDSASERVGEANAASFALFEGTRKPLVGRTLRSLFASSSASTLADMLSSAKRGGEVEEAWAKIDGRESGVAVSAHPMRQGGAVQFLILIRPLDDDRAPTNGAKDGVRLASLFETVADAIVITDLQGQIRRVNPAFLDLVQVAAENQVIGESLDRWLGRAGVDLRVLISNLREQGQIRLFATRVTGELGATADVEVSAVRLDEDASFGLVIRDVTHRLESFGKPATDVARSREQFADLIGRVPMKQIVRETTEAIERMCVEVALQLTGGNRASASELLGLSRQSFYEKLRRYDLAERES